MLREQGRYDEGEAILEETIARGDHSVLFEYGDLLAQSGRLDEAEATYREALAHGNADAAPALAELRSWRDYHDT